MSTEPAPRAHRRAARRVIDWQQAADLLAQGMTIADVAEQLGCSRSAVARRRRHDPAFQGWIARRREPTADPGAQPVDEPRPLDGAIEREVRAGNLRVLLWLAHRLKLATPPSDQTPDDELRELLRGLTAEELREFEQLRDAP